MIPSALPENFPIFPLTGALLLPHGQLPLNIFEPRYLSMVEDSLAQGRMFGMVQPRSAERETVGDRDPIFDTGCLGRITEFRETGDGRLEINLSGLCRFRITQELELRHGYRRVAGDFSPYVHDLDPSPGLIADRPALVEALKAFFQLRNLDTDWTALEESPDLVLVTTIAMGCPFKPEEKQVLLEADDLAARAERLQAILEMAVHAGDGPAARH